MSINLEKNLEKIIILLEDKGMLNDKWSKKLEDDKYNFNKMRLKYNDEVLRMCNLVKMFPSNIIASIFKFKTYEYFISEE